MMKLRGKPFAKGAHIKLLSAFL